jgi:serine/threonine protein kinase
LSRCRNFLVCVGSYGKVKEGIDTKTKKMVAIKILSKKTLRRVPGGEASVSREIGIIESLSHKNIISIITHFPIESKQKYYIVFEYMGGGNLTSLLESAPNKRLPLYQARKLFHNLLSGLEHLRERRILHRDIKPDNLLLDASGELKIADFGVAEMIGLGVASKLNQNAGIGSPAFQAPELIASPNSTPKKPKKSATDVIFKSDIWSAGIVLYVASNWLLFNTLLPNHWPLHHPGFIEG